MPACALVMMLVPSLWHHDVEMISESLSLCEENPGGFPLQRASIAKLGCSLCCLPEQKIKKKQLSCQWFETPWYSSRIFNSLKPSDAYIYPMDSNDINPCPALKSLVSISFNLFILACWSLWCHENHKIHPYLTLICHGVYVVSILE